MAEDRKSPQTGLIATAWSLMIIVCLALVIAHLVDAVVEGPASSEVIEATFTTNRAGG